MKIGILTGGGDVPGLNPCIRSITLSADDLGWQVVGFKRGWEGVLRIDHIRADRLEMTAAKARIAGGSRMTIRRLLGRHVPYLFSCRTAFILAPVRERGPGN